MSEKFRHFLNAINFDVIKLPDDVKKFANKMIVISILGALVPDILAFSLKGAQISMANGHLIIAIILLLLSFGDRVLNSLFDTWYTLQDDNYRRLSTKKSTKLVLNLSNKVRNKVFVEKDGIIQMVQEAEITKICKDYFSDYWAFYLKFPTTVAQVFILMLTLGISIYLESKTSSVSETIMITSLLLICIFIYFYLSNKRIKVWKSYRQKQKSYEAETDVLFTEINTTEFISENDFLYHANKLRDKLDSNIAISREENLKLNTVFIKRSITASILMIIIIIIKIITSTTFNLETFVEIAALSSIYGTMLQRIGSITQSYESIMNIIIDLEALYDSFSNINNTFESEVNKMIQYEPIKTISISEFSITQDKNGAFELINTKPFTLKSRDSVIVIGKTGCGKSTLINMLTGRMRLLSNPVSFSNGVSGYLSTIGYQTDRIGVNNFVLNEIILSDNLPRCLDPKLITILKGLHLYEEMLRMINEKQANLKSLSEDNRILEFLKTRKTREFSSGQQQRLALAKLLYSLDETIQLVALDEPFNRLDDSTCEACMKFIQEYVHQSQRLLIVATHQVSLCEPCCNVKISFGSDNQKSIMNVERKW